MWQCSHKKTECSKICKDKSSLTGSSVFIWSFASDSSKQLLASVPFPTEDYALYVSALVRFVQHSAAAGRAEQHEQRSSQQGFISAEQTGEPLAVRSHFLCLQDSVSCKIYCCKRSSKTSESRFLCFHHRREGRRKLNKVNPEFFVNGKMCFLK